MSDAKHTGEKVMPIWVDEELLKKFDEALKPNGYKNRADFIREKIRELINRKPAEK